MILLENVDQTFYVKIHDRVNYSDPSTIIRSNIAVVICSQLEAIASVS